jgi:flagellar basal-body rod protein FlgB
MMTQPIQSVTVDLVRLALDASVLRQQAIANNIANATTPGYQPARINFEGQLDAVRATLNQQGSLEAAQLGGIRPVLERQPAGSVELDLEAARMSENAAHYQALLKVLSKHHAILNIAISNGKR